MSEKTEAPATTTTDTVTITTTTTTSSDWDKLPALIDIPSAEHCRLIENVGRIGLILNAFKNLIFTSIWSGSQNYNPFFLNTPFELSDADKKYLEHCFGEKGFKVVIVNLPKDSKNQQGQVMYNKISIFF